MFEQPGKHYLKFDVRICSRFAHLPLLLSKVYGESERIKYRVSLCQLSYSSITACLLLGVKMDFAPTVRAFAVGSLVRP